MQRKKVFFSGLNELRAIAALSVVVHHVESHKQRDNQPSLFDTALAGFIENLGYNAVWLFFVLSGFLITYLLLVEHEETGRISVVGFYLRRALRIWPLYFLIVLLAFLVVPFLPGWVPGLADDTYVTEYLSSLSSNFGSSLLLFVLFLPNLALVLFGPVVGATHTWSIGSEEQFYLVWPVIVRLFRKVLPTTLLILILLKMLLVIVVFELAAKYDIQALTVFGNFLLTLRIELMAIGALAAHALLYHEQKVSWILTSRWVQGAVLLSVVVLLDLNFGASYLLLGLGFVFITLSVTVDGGIPLRNKILDRLGRVSYGIYMYHPLIIFLVFAMVRSMRIQSPVVYNVTTYGGVMALTVLVSFLSYRFFEQFFLRGKTRFSTVLSGDAVAERK